MFSSQNSQVSNNVNYIEDVFSTYLYTGNGSTQTITNGIDLAGESGLVWIKRRNTTGSNRLYDNVRDNVLSSNNTNAQSNPGSTYFAGVGSTGFTLGTNTDVNASGSTYTSWTFRKQPKFFDIVTYTGDGTTNRTVAHNLGSRPGFIAIKRTDSTSNWYCAARIDDDTAAVKNETAGDNFGFNSTDKADLGAWATVANTTTINLNMGGLAAASTTTTNINGATYVAYLFAHNAGGFGLTGTDNVISCGSFTTNGSGIATVNLGYEPQLVLYKSTAAGAYDNDWYIADNMRGWSNDGSNGQARRLFANTTGAESLSGSGFCTSTGFYYTNQSFVNTYIYISIRRPMKVPTLGTSVFTPIARTGTGANATVTSVGFPVDLLMSTSRQGFDAESWWDRLRNTGGAGRLLPSSTSAEIAGSTDSLTGLDVMDGFKVGVDTNGRINYSPWTYVYHCFRRAPGFFDEVCYTGNGSTAANGQIVAHNLTVSPELLIIKPRSIAGSWITWASSLGVDGSGRYYDLLLETSGARGLFTLNGNALTTSPIYSTTQIGVGGANTNASTQTYVAYLFATVAGVSKVGSYTGTGALQTVACGFTSGARFVLIKRTDAVGDWYVWDSARGITSGNDPYLLLNTTAAEVTATNYVDTDTTGFKVTAAAPAGINASGGTFLFLAIA